MESETLPIELQMALDAISPWLDNLGYSLSVDTDTSLFGEHQVGSYDAQTVFSKEIVIRVSLPNIEASTRRNPLPLADYLAEVHLTVFHEVGHAMAEQLKDYCINVSDDIREINKLNGNRFDGILEDIFTREETLVEEFARDFYYKRTSLFQECVEAMI